MYSDLGVHETVGAAFEARKTAVGETGGFRGCTRGSRRWDLEGRYPGWWLLEM
jgi:hypothetical protein